MLNLTTYFAKLTGTTKTALAVAPVVAAPVAASKDCWNVFNADCTLFATVMTEATARQVAKQIGGWIGSATR